MSRTKIFSVTLALMLAVSLAGLNIAEARSWHRGGPDAAYTQEQSAEMKALWDEHYKQAQPLHRQLRAKQAELEQQYYIDGNDNARVQKIFRDMADIKAKLFTVNNDYRAKCEARGFGGGYGLGYGHEGGYKGNCGGGPRHGWNGGDDGRRGHRGGW
ncbi:MAG: hypothetical protein LBM64_09585 [Deltaproteobacteria bacterium]|jgi:hypothetical protein|nr:hypothetical protein [Deltaproteobacteria bacterium]